MRSALCVLVVVIIGCGGAGPEDQTLVPFTPEVGPIPISMITIVPPGETATFLMGSTDEELAQQPSMDHEDYITHDEQPAHEVTLSRAYAMSRFEITNHEFCEVMNRTLTEGGTLIQDGDLVGPDGTKYLGIKHLVDDKHLGVQHGISVVEDHLVVNEGYDDHPVHGVTWYGAVAFCNFLSIQEGREPAYDLVSWSWDPDAQSYHLPTEAQWEYAARKDLRRIYAWGDEISSNHLSYWPTTEQRTDGKPTMAVGSFDGSDKVGRPTEDNSSPFGLYDMNGNVWEWVWDWYGADYYSQSPAADPQGPETGDDRPPYDVEVPTKVWRGCGWAGNDAFSRIAKRWSSSPGTAINETGFRIALRL